MQDTVTDMNKFQSNMPSVGIGACRSVYYVQLVPVERPRKGRKAVPRATGAIISNLPLLPTPHYRVHASPTHARGQLCSRTTRTMYHAAKPSLTETFECSIEMYHFSMFSGDGIIMNIVNLPIDITMARICK